ncbi:MAG: PadR family transcriptional regulator [Methylobacteriaceae bacterium]|nr:PadR family transcriptional regulator [Methylobacteriaceae bacterium]
MRHHHHQHQGCGPRGFQAISRGFGRHFGRAFAGEGFGERGGRRRMFDSGELRLVLLKLISDQPRHGYDLIRAIEELTGGAYAPSPGVVYPTLTMLEDMGHIDEQKSEGARKAFAITAEGAAHLESNKAEVDAILARLASLAAELEKFDGVTVRRAMLNLRMAIRGRLMQEGADKATMREVTAILDEAARKIEGI